MIWFLGLAALLVVGFLVCLEIRRSKPAPELKEIEDPIGLAALTQSDLKAIEEGEEPLPVDPDLAKLDIETLANMVKESDEGAASEPAPVKPTDSEEIVLVWDDTAGPKPELSVTENASDPKLVDVLMDHDVVASLPKRKGFDPRAITLIPMSKAISLGWAEA